MSFGIGMICWKVRKTMVKKFPSFWEKELKIRNKRGLIFEFLCKVEPSDYDMFNWKIYKEKGVNYINVGFWNSKKDFLREMDNMPKEVLEEAKKFKWGKTIRLWLTPRRIRKGFSVLKMSDAKLVD